MDISVSVIISTYSKDKLKLVLGCIKTMRMQSLQPIEILLVLDSNSELIECYKKYVPPDVKVISSGGFGLSKARNAGIQFSHGSIVAFIDDDAFADDDWLRNLVKPYSNPSVMGTGGLIKPLWEDGTYDWFPEELNWIVGCSYKGLPQQRTHVRNPIGCNMSFRRNIFSKIGYFREDVGRFGQLLLAGEEPDISMRVRNEIPKAKIVYEPTAIVFHRISKNKMRIKYLLLRSFCEGISKAKINDSENDSLKQLDTESDYLKYILTFVIPSKLKQANNPKNLCHLFTMAIMVGSVIAGFISAKLSSSGSNE